jgi:hypothetical protein
LTPYPPSCKAVASLVIKITPVKLRGERRYKFEARAGGKRTRQFFKTPTEAVTAEKVMLKPHEETGRGFAVMTAREKTDTLTFIVKVRASGHTYDQVLEIVNAANKPGLSCSLGQVIEEMLKAKVEANRRPKYIKGLGKYARLFARGRE